MVYASVLSHSASLLRPAYRRLPPVLPDDDFPDDDLPELDRLSPDDRDTLLLFPAEDEFFSGATLVGSDERFDGPELFELASDDRFGGFLLPSTVPLDGVRVLRSLSYPPDDFFEPRSAGVLCCG
jgi:hypothetical protein